MTVEHLANELLSQIEIAEAEFLDWGFIQTEIDLESEIDNLIAPLKDQLEQSGCALEDVLSNLEDRRLIFQTQSGRYRSRFGETIRLLYLLRQRFSDDDWLTASRLVSDIRLHLRRRRYPRRDQDAAQLINTLQSKNADDAFLNAVRRLTAGLMLSAFQVRAIMHQHDTLTFKRGERALVIGAGTGAGKTKAFYIPALAYIAQTLIANRHHAVKVIAIYPRNELLKDQLAEAVTEAAKLGGTPRPITIGAYYGDSPYSTQYEPKWAKRGNGFLFPMMKCPNSVETGVCGGDLIWSDADRKLGHARLTCDRCHFQIDEQRLMFVRDTMRNSPPDVLFTTTEMLNRMLARANEHHLVGVGVTPPRLLLLDEIHTYEGLNGAQVAYLLRRWRNACGYGKPHPLSIVGLSATLTEAETFFANLTGLERHAVRYIAPQDDELIPQGMEYNLVLRGDPASGAALLSTSVQSAMLLGRILDPLSSQVSNQLYPSKVFAFSDNLDVINRWYRIQDDAESKRLSRYRGLQNLSEAQYLAGQDWRLPRLLGHDLDQSMRLERTTSLDRGVDPSATLVVASSTLEVGFNDRQVGAVIQHKSPRGMASFLQRKGRAGRLTVTRPWTLVITSAYGRDRYAFQHSEMLFEPILPPLDLPIDNDYIRKIQAAYATLDWLANQLDSQEDVWRLLTKREDNTLREQMRATVDGVLSGRTQALYCVELSKALNISQDDPAFHSLLYGEPRSVMFHLLPTLARQLKTVWRQVETGENQTLIINKEPDVTSPLPDFAPTNLFSDLNLPEVQIQLPYKDDDAQPSMSLGIMFSEFAPGKANERYSRRGHRNAALWLALPDESETSRGKCALSTLRVKRDQVPIQVELDGETVNVYRPQLIMLETLPTKLKPTTNAFMIWRSHFAPRPENNGSSLQLAPNSPWRQLIQRATVYAQSQLTWVNVTRVGIGVKVDKVFANGDRSHQEIEFVEGEDKPTALGYQIAVDALRFDFRALDVAQLLSLPKWDQLRIHLMPQLFRYRLLNDRRLRDAGLNLFEIDWLWQLEYSMVIATAVSRQTSIRSAADEVAINRKRFAERTMRIIFQSQTLDGAEINESKLEGNLKAYLELQPVKDALADGVRALWEPMPNDLVDWLQRVYASSIGAVLFTAIVGFVENIAESNLAMDIDGNTIWVSETTPGGIGLIQRIAEAIALHPRDFDMQLRDTLRHCDRQHLALQLSTIADQVLVGNPRLAEGFRRLRDSQDLRDLAHSREHLAETLDSLGIPATRDVIVSLNTKFLRPNSLEDTDRLAAKLAQRWREEEHRLRCAIDLRVMAVAARRIPEIDAEVRAIFQRIGGTDVLVSEEQTFNALQSMLWMDCQDSCPECIQYTSHFAEHPMLSRALLLALLDQRVAAVAFGVDGWLETMQDALQHQYEVFLSCTQQEVSECKAQLLEAIVQPVDIGFQMLYPVIERVEHNSDGWLFALSLREMVGE